MPKSPPVSLRHPSMPGDFVVVGAHRVASMSKRGWVEAKSSAAKAAVEKEVPAGDSPTPSKEDKS